MGEYRIFGVDLERKTNKHLSDYDMVRKGKDLTLSLRVKPEEPQTQTKSQIMGQKLVKDYIDDQKGISDEKKPTNFLISKKILLKNNYF